MLEMPVIDMVKTGENIVLLRKKAGLKVGDIQEVFGFSTPQAIYKWQKGLSLPSVDNMVILAKLLNVKIDDILILEETTWKSSA